MKHLRRGGGSRDLQGHIHQAAVCRAAGPLWERAFCLAKARSRWVLLPSSLGFDLGVLESFKYERRLKRRGYSVLPNSTGLDDGRYRLSLDATPLERLEVSLDLWVGGRSFKTEQDVMSWNAFKRSITKPSSAFLRARAKGWSGGELSFVPNPPVPAPLPRGEVVLAESRLSCSPVTVGFEEDGELLVVNPSRLW